jgi:hypothetical protein
MTSIYRNGIICASVLVHGVSATPLTKLYGRLPGD